MDLKSKNELEAWLISFVKALRNDIYKDPVLMEGLSNLDWFLEPCQIIVLWFTDPETQIIIVTHFDDIRDLTIEIYGPVPAYMFSEIALKVAEKDWWHREIPAKDKQHHIGIKTYKDLIESTLVSIKHFLEKAPFIRPDPATCQKTTLVFTKKDFVWFIRGNLADLDINGQVSKIINEARRRKQVKTKMEERKVKPATKTEIVKGCCVYMYPFLWIGEPPKLTLQQRLRGIVFPSELRKIVQEVEISSVKTLIFNDGLIFAQTENKKLALKIINLIATSMLINGISVFVSRELDLIEATFNRAGYFTHMRGKTLSSRVEVAFKPEELQERILSVKIGGESIVNENKFLKVIKTVKKLSMNEELSTLAIALLEAYTYLVTGSYREAFVCGWGIIEYYIGMLWDNLIKERTDEHRRNKLKDPNYINIDHTIEILSLLDLISKDKYENLMRLKRIRNKVIHKLYEPSAKEAEELYNMAFNILLQLMK